MSHYVYISKSLIFRGGVAVPEEKLSELGSKSLSVAIKNKTIKLKKSKNGGRDSTREGI